MSPDSSPSTLPNETDSTSRESRRLSRRARESRRSNVRVRDKRVRASIHNTHVAVQPQRRLFAKMRVAAHRQIERFRSSIENGLKVLAVLLVTVGAIAVGRLVEQRVRTSSFFAVRDLAITGNSRFSTDEVAALAGIRVGQNVFDMPSEDAEARLLANPWIARATVVRHLPGRYEIRIAERKAIAMLALESKGSSMLYLVAEDGLIFKRVQEADTVDLPVITGLELRELEEENGKRYVTELARLLYQYKNLGLPTRHPIHEVHVGADESVSLYVAPDATEIRLGMAPYRQKLVRLREVWKALAKKNAQPAYVYLDNDVHKGQVTVRLR